MGTVSELMNQIAEKCEIRLNDKTISQELLLKTFTEYLSKTIEKNSHNVGVIMHTGSICFDAILVSYAAISNLVSNRLEVNDVLESLEIGDTVLYGSSKKERYVFEGCIEGKEIRDELKGIQYIKLSQGKGKVTYVASKAWHYIEPYNGNSESLDGRGIRRKKTSRDDFYIDVLGYKKEDIPSVIDTSSVVVMPKDEAVMLIQGISILFCGKRVGILDLVTASYFTEEDEYHFSGNTGKNEAVLKFAGKVSVARSLIVSNSGNRHLGLLVCGKDVISHGMSELPELLGRRSLQYVYLGAPMEYDFGNNIIDDNEDIEIFACTKNFLLEHTTPSLVSENEYTSELQEQTDIIIDRGNEAVVMDDEPISKSEYLEFRRSLISLKRLEFTGDEKDNFVMHSHALMNMCITAAFSLEKLNHVCERGLIDIESPKQKVTNLRRWASLFPSSAKQYTEQIIDKLEKVLINIKKTTPKMVWLNAFLRQHSGEKIAIIVPKAYYIAVLRDSGMLSAIALKKVTFATTGRFDGTKRYDYIISLGDYEGKAFDAFRCNASTNILSLLYECEKGSYYFKERNEKKKERKYQSRSTIHIEYADEEQFEELPEEKESVALDSELNDFISNIDMSGIYSSYRGTGVGSSGNMMTEIVAIASFTDETRAFFSKHYKGYVLDEAAGTVSEVKATDFCEGDSIVFTKNNGDTKDIVSFVLSKNYIEGKLDKHSEESYRLANRWKNSLIEYMNENDYKAREVARQMLKIGASVQEATILTWLDEDAHTVGPRSVESLRSIGELTNDDVLKSNPESVFEACREVRSIRRRILDQIGVAIVNRLSGKTIPGGTEFTDIFENVDSLAVVSQIEHISFTETVVPMNIANRPLSM